MIQRLQTLFLALASLLLGGQYFTPYFSLIKKVEGLEAGSVFSDGLLTLSDSPIFMGFAFVAALFCVIAIFRYQNRKHQISTAYIALVGALISFVGIGFTGYSSATALVQENDMEMGFGGLLPMAAMVLILMAIRNIRKDDALVRSMDRLR